MVLLARPGNFAAEPKDKAGFAEHDQAVAFVRRTRALCLSGI